MPKSVLDAIKSGEWDFEPQDVAYADYEATRAMPGTRAGREQATLSRRRSKSL